MSSFCLVLVLCCLVDGSLIVDHFTIVGQRICVDKPDLTAQVADFTNGSGNGLGEVVISV